jgi:hypothetical protein
MPLVIDLKKPPPPDVAGRSWSLDPIAGDLRGQREALSRAEEEEELERGRGDTLGVGRAREVSVRRLPPLG